MPQNYLSLKITYEILSFDAPTTAKLILADMCFESYLNRTVGLSVRVSNRFAGHV